MARGAGYSSSNLKLWNFRVRKLSFTMRCRSSCISIVSCTLTPTRPDKCLITSLAIVPAPRDPAARFHVAGRDPAQLARSAPPARQPSGLYGRG